MGLQLLSLDCRPLLRASPWRNECVVHDHDDGWSKAPFIDFRTHSTKIVLELSHPYGCWGSGDKTGLAMVLPYHGHLQCDYICTFSRLL